MVIRLTPDIETALEQQAKRRGTTPEQLALEALGSMFLPPPPSESSSEKATLFDLLSGYIGTVEGTGETLSENCGQRFSEELVAKHERGHL
jgi:hypothetical protein